MSAFRRFPLPVVLSLVSFAIGSLSVNAEDVPKQTAPQQLASGGDALVKSGAVPITSNTIADIAEAVAPAVVNIDMDRPGQQIAMQGLPFDFGGISQFFLFNGERLQPNAPDPNGTKPPTFRTPERHGTGSGFIVRKDGYIVTNNHVINKASKIKVTLNDKRTFVGTVVGTDPFSDLAVIKIDADNLPTLTMGSSAMLRPGEFCIAVGSALNYDHTVTLGIISAKDREVLDINGNINFIQTDAAINLGNSGGPLLNLAGEVIGVNTAIDQRGQRIGFSIPVDIVKSVANELIEHKSVQRPWLGVGLTSLSETLIKSLGIPSGTQGVLVGHIFEHSPAIQAGLQEGDLIEQIDGQSVSSPKQLQTFVRSHKVRDTLNLTVWRAGTLKTYAIVLGEMPDRVSNPRAEDDGE